MPFKGLFGSKKGKELPGSESPASDPFAPVVLTPGFYGRFPQSFHVFFTGIGNDKKTKFYCLAADRLTPMYALTEHPGMVKHQLTLHSTADPNSAPIALGGIDKLFSGKGCIGLPAFPGGPMGNQIVYLKDKGFKEQKSIFSAMVGPEPHIEVFEWRKPPLIPKKGEPCQSKLVRLGAPHGEEIVCVWTKEEHPEAESRLGSVQFYGSGASGELGPFWTLLAVMALIRDCQVEWTAQVVLDGMLEAAAKLASFGVGFA